MIIVKKSIKKNIHMMYMFFLLDKSYNIINAFVIPYSLRNLIKDAAIHNGFMRHDVVLFYIRECPSIESRSFFDCHLFFFFSCAFIIMSNRMIQSVIVFNYHTIRIEVCFGCSDCLSHQSSPFSFITVVSLFH